MKTYIATLSVFAAMLLSLAARVEAATYYVAIEGSDSNPGSQAFPFRTIKRGAAVLVPGDVLYVSTGTYPESLYDAIPGGASWTVPVTVAALPGGPVILQPGAGTGSVFYFSAPSSRYIVISGFVIDGIHVTHDAIKIGGSGGNASRAAHHIRFQNSEVKNAPANGILVTDYANDNQFAGLRVHDNGQDNLDHGFYIATSGNLVEHSEIYGNSGEGVQIFNQRPSAPVDNNVVRYNRTHDNGWAGSGCGMILTSGTGNLAYNNLVWNNRCGIITDYGAAGTRIYNNTVYKNSGVGIQTGSRSSGAAVVNNISYLNAGAAIVVNGRGNTADHNLTTNPSFVDPAAFNFHLQAGSPAVDAGVALIEVSDDYDGVPRPQGPGFDAGAYELPVR